MAESLQASPSLLPSPPLRSEVKSLSHVQLLQTPWTVAYHAPPSMGFSKQEYWSGLPFPSLKDLSGPGIEQRSSVRLQGLLPPGLYHLVFPT